MLVYFEGIDGVGKSTQISMFERECIKTCEPGGTQLGKSLRELIFKSKASPRAEIFLFLADRAQHVDCIIKPALKEGIIVLCDRHTDSTVAYQGYGRKLDIEQIKKLNNIAVGDLKPDLTIVFDIDIETSMQRVGSTKDRMESAGIEFFKRVREGFLAIAKEEPSRVKVINSADTIENIHKQVVKLVEEKNG